MKKMFLLFVCILLNCVQSSYAVNEEYFNMKYASYECVKDGQTCEYTRFEGGASSKGDACPKAVKGKSFEQYINETIELINSPYCKQVPMKIKKYECNYGQGQGTATIYIKNGKVIQGENVKIEYTNIQDLYQKDKCRQVEMKRR